MTSTKQFFLTCLDDHLHNRQTIGIPRDVDMDELFVLSKSHDVVGIIYHQLKKELANKAPFLQNYSASIFYFAGRNKCFEQLTTEFNKHSIRFAVVKGQAIAPLYPVPALRTMGDIDLLICESQKPQIHEIMAQLRYECLSDSNSRDWDYKNNTIEFELHPLMIYPDEQVEKKEYIRFFNDFWPYVDVHGNLKKEFHLLYLFVHLRKHLLNHGAGVRQFMDIAVFTGAYQKEMDWNWIGEKLEELDLTRFAQMCYTFLYRWFEFDSPMEILEISEELYQNSTQRILENGVFGFQAADDKEALLSYDVAKGGKAGRLKHLLRLVFPSYSLMKTMKQYSFVDGKPFLLPVAWLIRIVRLLRRGNIKIPKSNISQGKIDMINSWGMK